MERLAKGRLKDEWWLGVRWLLWLPSAWRLSVLGSSDSEVLKAGCERTETERESFGWRHQGLSSCSLPLRTLGKEVVLDGKENKAEGFT